MIRKTTKVDLKDSTLFMGPLSRTAFRMSDTDEDRQFRQALQEGQTKGKAASPERWGYTPKPGMLYVAVRAISSRVNANFDGWPKDELEKGWRSFIGRPVFVEHQNWDHTKTRGVILDAKLHKDRLASGQDDWWVELLTEVDVNTYPKLGTAIVQGDIDSVSMGCDVEYTVCSACGNKARDVFEFCAHIPALKGQTISVKTADGREDARLVYESCHGINFFEISYVFDPADESAFVSDFYKADASLANISSGNTSTTASAEWSRSSIDLSRLKAASKTAEPQVRMRMPSEVDTLREEIVCSICGTEYDDTEEVCPECGHQEPPEGYQDPDTEPRGEQAERLQEVMNEFGETDGEPQPLDEDGTPHSELESETPQGDPNDGTSEGEGDSRPDADEIEEEFGVSLPNQNIDFYVTRDKDVDEKGRRRRRRRKRQPDASQASKNAWHEGLVAGLTGKSPAKAEPQYLRGHREGLRQFLRNGDEDMQTNTATSDRTKRIERARAIARAKARRAARSKAASNTQTEKPDQAREHARAKARAAAKKKAATRKAPTKEAATEPDYSELREKLRAQARQRFASRIEQIRQADSNEQERNKPATEDVEAKGAGSVEQERNAPDTEDVESDNFNDSSEQSAADRPSDVNDSGQGNSAVTNDDSAAFASKGDKGDLIQIFTYVEDLEQRGILNRSDRYANIARFEQMGGEKFAGYKAAMEDAKQHIEAAKTSKPAPRPRKASRNDEERPVARVPQLGRHSVEATAGGDGDHMDDSLAFL